MTDSTVRNGCPSTVKKTAAATVILMIGRSIRHTCAAYLALAGMFGPLSRVLFVLVFWGNVAYRIERLMFIVRHPERHKNKNVFAPW